MVRHRPLFWSGILALGLLAACQVPATLPEGSRVRLRFYDGRTRVMLEMANQSHPDWHDVYSHSRNTATLKLVPETMLGPLLEDLDAAGFQQFSTPGPPPTQGPLHGFLSIQREGDERTLVVPDGTRDAELLAAFARMKLLVDETYGKVGALQYIENPDGDRLFESGRAGGGR